MLQPVPRDEPLKIPHYKGQNRFEQIDCLEKGSRGRVSDQNWKIRRCLACFGNRGVDSRSNCGIPKGEVMSSWPEVDNTCWDAIHDQLALERPKRNCSRYHVHGGRNPSSLVFHDERVSRVIVAALMATNSLS
jgi:hypothetical protein